MPWTFKNRLDQEGVNVIRAWLDQQPLKVRLKINEVLKNLRVNETLGYPLKKITNYEGVFELVIRHNKVQYRPLGGYGPNDKQFTFVLGAIEHNDNIRPSDAFATAEGHIARVKAGTCRVCDHEYEKPSP